jgi:hypothetical protein
MLPSKTKAQSGSIHERKMHERRILLHWVGEEVSRSDRAQKKAGARWGVNLRRPLGIESGSGGTGTAQIRTRWEEHRAGWVSSVGHLLIWTTHEARVFRLRLIAAWLRRGGKSRILASQRKSQNALKRSFERNAGQDQHQYHEGGQKRDVASDRAKIRPLEKNRFEGAHRMRLRIHQRKLP